MILVPLSDFSGAAAAADCTNPTAFAGDGACTNSQTLNSFQTTISAGGNLDLTNTATGQIGAGGNASFNGVYAGGGLTLNNAGQILTLTGSTNYLVRLGNIQAGATTIVNSGYIGDQAPTNGGTIVAIFADNLSTSFMLTNTATGTIKSTYRATGSGVLSYASTSTVTNAGTISTPTGSNGSTVGMFGFTTATLTNSGSLNAAGAAAAFGVVANATGTLNVTNSGGIWAGASAFYLLGGVVANIGNTGTVTAGGSVFDLTNARATIVNDGTITGTGAPTANRGVRYNPAINVASGSSLDLTNRGTITALGAGIQVASGALSANITNSGAIQATSTNAPGAIKVSGLYLDSTTSGTTVTNSGTISGAQYGIYLNTGAMTLNNTGTLSGATGLAAGAGAVATIFNAGTISGTGGTAVDLTTSGAGSVFTLGSGYSITGLVKGKSTDTFQLGGIGAAAFDLSSFGVGKQYQGFTTLNVVGGTWTATGTGGATNVAVQGGTLRVDGSLTAVNDITVASGGTLSGIGTIADPTIQSGGTLAPGNAASSYGTLTIGGPLTFQSGSFFNVNVNAAGQASNVLVTNGSTVTINGGTVQVNAAAGAYSPTTRYTLINAAAGVTGQFTGATTNLAFLQPMLSYGTANVYLNMGQKSFASGAATGNQAAVGRGIDAGNQQNSDLTNSLVAALNQITLLQVPGVLNGLSAEGLAGAQTTAFKASNLFTNAMSDQMTGVGSGNAVTLTETRPGFMSYAAMPDRTLDGLGDGLAVKAAPHAQRRTWSVWASGFGASDTLRGDTVVGTANQTSSAYGGAMGADYHLTDNLRLGVAVGGSDARFNVADRATSGRLTGGFVGLYSLAQAGVFYGAGSFSFASHSNTTTRQAGGFGGLLAETERGQFGSTVFDTRLELGRRFAIPQGDISPFVAVDVASLRSSRFTETAIVGPGVLALTVADQSTASTVSEIGLRYRGKITLHSGMTFAPLLDAAWQHEFTPQRNEAGQFVSLPGAAFIVQGAQPAANAARVKAGGELGLTPQTALFASFNGQFSQVNRLYGGSGGFKWLW